MTVKKKIRRRPVKAKQKKSAGSGTKINIRKEIRELTLKIIKDRNLKLEDLSRLADDILSQTATTLKDALPASRKSALIPWGGGYPNRPLMDRFQAQTFFEVGT